MLDVVLVGADLHTDDRLRELYGLWGEPLELPTTRRRGQKGSWNSENIRAERRYGNPELAENESRHLERDKALHRVGRYEKQAPFLATPQHARPAGTAGSLKDVLEQMHKSAAARRLYPREALRWQLDAWIRSR